MDGLPVQTQNYLQPLIEAFANFLPKLMAAIVIFVVTIYVAAFVGRLIRRIAQRRSVDSEISLLVSRLGRWLVIIMGMLWALETVDGNITGFIAGLGLVGFTIGFALQDIAKNFVAGILLLWQQPFDVGDAIEVVSFSGKVINVSVRATELLTFDGLHVVIPNAEVYINPIINYSKATERRLALNVGVAYDADLEHVTRTALAAIAELPGVMLESAKEPEVVFNNFGESTIDFTLYYWIDLDHSRYLLAQDQGVKLLKSAFERERIDMPYPVRTVQITQQHHSGTNLKSQ